MQQHNTVLLLHVSVTILVFQQLLASKFSAETEHKYQRNNQRPDYVSVPLEVLCSSIDKRKIGYKLESGINCDLLGLPAGRRGWIVTLKFTDSIKELKMWNAKIIRHDRRNQTFIVRSKWWANGQREAKFNAFAETPGRAPCVLLRGEDVWKCAVDEEKQPPTAQPTKRPSDSKYDYSQVLQYSLLFYEAQRSGRLPDTNRVTWRGDSGLYDGQDNGVDLTGGWYDAGDFMKFNLPMASATTILLWGLLEFKDSYMASAEYHNMLGSVKWPLDYFLKCHTSPNELYVQVGSMVDDHKYWGRPEDMRMMRPSYKITPSNPGSDVAAETSASMAAGYLVFRETRTLYARKLLRHAKELFDFAQRYQGTYTASGGIPAGDAYRSSGYHDELAWAAGWLYRATGDRYYLSMARWYTPQEPGWAFSWDEKTPGVQLLMYQLTSEDVYRRHFENYMASWQRGGDVWYTPKGLAWRTEWGPLRYASNTAFLALIAAKEGLSTQTYLPWAETQIHYALGDTGRSFVVGFGNNPPTRPHHASSSCPRSPHVCGWSDFETKSPNPQVLYGALVGGPDSDDNFRDDREDYYENEVSCDYNAGFQSAVAGLKYFSLNDRRKIR